MFADRHFKKKGIKRENVEKLRVGSMWRRLTHTHTHTHQIHQNMHIFAFSVLWVCSLWRRLSTSLATSSPTSNSTRCVGSFFACVKCCDELSFIYGFLVCVVSYTLIINLYLFILIVLFVNFVYKTTVVLSGCIVEVIELFLK